MQVKVKRGDTIVEVAFAIAIFSLIAVISITLMNSGLATAQASLEVTMARNEIDAQAEAIRFIHNSFSLERELPVDSQEYRDLWYTLSRDSGAINGGMVNAAENIPELSVESCSWVYDGQSHNNKNYSILNNSNLTAFVVNTRALDPNDSTFNDNKLKEIIVSTKDASTNTRFTETLVSPRVLFSDIAPVGTNASDNNSEELSENGDYRYVSRAEGIWVIAARDETDNASVVAATPEFYDFHIYTCWYAPGRHRPNTIGTIIRLYNPELVEGI